MSKLTDHQVVRRGRGRQILFVNGFGCSKSVWDPVAEDLVRDHEIISYDYAGAGGARTEAYDRDRHATLHGHAEDLIQICREAGLQRPVVVAHSVGTQITILAARQDPSIFDSLILLAPSPSYLNHDDFKGGFDIDDIENLLETLDANYFAWAHMMAPVIMGKENHPQDVEDLEQSFCQTDPAIAGHFARVIFTADHRRDIDGLGLRTSLLQCQDDALAPPEVGSYMSAHIAGSRLVQLTATGHCPHVSSPVEVIQAIRDHLASQEDNG